MSKNAIIYIIYLPRTQSDLNLYTASLKITVPNIPKPCIILQYCPYGTIVELFPLNNPYSKQSCADVNGAIIPFGHDCPVHYNAEFYHSDKVS